MIEMNELKKIAEFKRISMEKAEKDYMQELILFFIYKETGDALTFKGGTALYKIFSLNRFSEDLDFTLNKKKINIKKIIDKCIFSLSILKIRVKIIEIKEFRNEINVKLLLNGPLYRGSRETSCFISMNISLRERVNLFKEELIQTLYKEIPSFGVYVMEPEEILAEKIRAIMSREKARDVYDLWFLLKRNTKINIGLINKKLKICKLSFSKKELEKNISKNKQSWESDLGGLLIGSLPKFEEVKNEILSRF